MHCHSSGRPSESSATVRLWTSLGTDLGHLPDVNGDHGYLFHDNDFSHGSICTLHHPLRSVPTDLRTGNFCENSSSASRHAAERRSARHPQLTAWREDLCVRGPRRTHLNLSTVSGGRCVPAVDLQSTPRVHANSGKYMHLHRPVGLHPGHLTTFEIEVSLHCKNTILVADLTSQLAIGVKGDRHLARDPSGIRGGIRANPVTAIRESCGDLLRAALNLVHFLV
mmetsp:Transcript_15289/g.38685  ORF Transcript_15289/g.38685 Transcript_15289/m.38685 type:complete len:224 (-) Transcript_15289:277-948(-)